MARLDEIYCLKHHLVFSKCVKYFLLVCLIIVLFSALLIFRVLSTTVPTGIFNTGNLNDKPFREALNFLRVSHQKNKSGFSSVQREWDLEKSLMKQF